MSARGWMTRVVVAGLAAVGLGMGSVMLHGPSTADAAGTVSASLGVGCSASTLTGASLRFNMRAQSNLDVYINRVTLTVNATTVSDSGPINQQYYSKQVSVPVTTGSYSIVMTLDTDDLPDVTRTATANVFVGPNSVSCSVHSP